MDSKVCVYQAIYSNLQALMLLVDKEHEETVGILSEMMNCWEMLATRE